MLRKAWQSGLIQFVAVLSAIAWGFVFLGEWLETVPDAARQTWFSAHWWQIAVVFGLIWLAGRRERSRYRSGYRRGLNVARARVCAAENRARMTEDARRILRLNARGCAEV